MGLVSRSDGVEEAPWKPALRVLVLAFALYSAYDIRTFALKTYGMVIHEFDPWFNYRATEYLAAHGREAFFKWYDYMVWYPLGRPIGSTIYPGMQFAAVWIWQGLNSAGVDISLNDVCCFVPCWFGVTASIFTGLIAYECSGFNPNAGTLATLVMAIIPAHIMRSVGGGYDNESVAMTCMTATFYFWVRSLRDDASWPFAILTGIAYYCMVATWGGYIFVLNMIALHALSLAVLHMFVHERFFTAKTFRAYVIFYAIGTLGAIQIPIVGLTPLKSMEQLGALAVFLGYFLLKFICNKAEKEKMDAHEKWALTRKVAIAGAVAGGIVVGALWPTGYFGPLSSRIRGLFVQHTRTGNPLVDSVAEHQPTSPQAYWQYLNVFCYFAPFGMIGEMVNNPTQSATFLVAYAFVTYYFCSKMSRLVILLGPMASCLGSIFLVWVLEWATSEMFEFFNESMDESEEAAEEDAGPTASPAPGSAKKGKKKKKGPAVSSPTPSKGGEKKNKKGGAPKNAVDNMVKPIKEWYAENKGSRRIMAFSLSLFLLSLSSFFYRYSYSIGEQMSGPSIMYRAKSGSGEMIMVDDYREAYWWLRDNTAEDARVMAWWDYGYQITGIGNRTSIADGNTWNHEHIATLGRCLSAPEKSAHTLVRHIADYVLIWAGGGGDDLAKSPHMARIGNSVFFDICPDDPTCSNFGFTDHATMAPKPMMAKSLLYKLHSGNSPQHPEVKVDADRWENVFNSKYGKVRIWKVKDVDEESKAWAADPTNRKCSEKPGEEWICPGDYPPGFKSVPAFGKRKAFRQREDFNVKEDEESEEYVKKYMAKMGGH